MSCGWSGGPFVEPIVVVDETLQRGCVGSVQPIVSAVVHVPAEAEAEAII